MESKAESGIGNRTKLESKAESGNGNRTKLESKAESGIGNQTKLESKAESGIGSRAKLESKVESGIGVPTYTWNRGPFFDLVSKPGFEPGSGFKELWSISLNKRLWAKSFFRFLDRNFCCNDVKIFLHVKQRSR